MPGASRGSRIIEQLRQLRSNSPDVEASAVVSADGLIIASDLPAGSEEDRVSAMSAAMLSLGDRIASELSRGTLEQVFIRGAQGYVFLTSANEDTVLTVLVRKDAKLGLIFLDIRRAADEIGKMI
jgi:predicted regulator of Ras-like GTPase activity (Roadblock/LC7/MglB family)